ncbi:MAG: phosphate ABC transporter substrate-binding protein [Deltaproteobacteria bacterium]|nr:phosphate ABC transporter substrate-binding protein [Deltaproteobacteria bacterium]
MKATTKRVFLKMLVLSVTGVFLCVTPSGCSKDKQEIRVAGSTTIRPFMKRVSDYYAEKGDLDIRITSGGSMKGIVSLIAGQCDIAMCSSPIPDRLRIDARSKGINIKSFAFAHDMIVPIVHPSNPINNLTLGQLRDIYTGAIESWSGLGGRPDFIETVTRSSSSGTAEVWKNVILPSNALKIGGVVESSNSGVLAYVAEHPDAIGYVSFAILNHEVKPLSINGVPPTVNSAKQGKYPILRPLYLYVDEDNLSYDVKSLIVFVLSARGQQVVSQCGLIPRDALK